METRSFQLPSTVDAALTRAVKATGGNASAFLRDLICAKLIEIGELPPDYERRQESPQ